MRYAAALSLWLALFAVCGCRSNRMQVPLDDSPQSALVWREKLDPDVFAERTKALRLSFDTMVLPGVRVGPAMEFKNTAQQHWNDNVATVNTMYKALANDWNSGLLSIARFNQKRDQIDAIYAQLAKERDVLQNVKNDQEQQKIVDRCREMVQSRSQDLTGK